MWSDVEVHGELQLMNLVHLTASTFLGGPERQMLGLARFMGDDVRSVFVSFSEKGKSRQFLSAARQQGFEAASLLNDTPHFLRCIKEIENTLHRFGADAVLCHGYKPNILGAAAARRKGIPCVSVSRGWTGENWKVRLYEKLDRFHLRFIDHIVAVSSAQGDKVRRCGIAEDKLSVIPNAIDPDRFVDTDPRYRSKLEKYFRSPKSRIIGAAGRLSPEKGFDVLVAAASRVLEAQPDVGFVIFGHGPCKELLQQQIHMLGLTGYVVLGGFRNDLDRFIPQMDLFVLPSFSEGLPNVVLESCAAGVPVVATAVGGTPEIIDDGVNGLLVQPGDPDALAERILEAIECEETMRELGFQGRQKVLERFSFPAQVDGYTRLFKKIIPGRDLVNSNPRENIAPEEVTLQTINQT
ncbi:MAG: glycosyltransferase [Gemmataceae bacterium]